MFDDDDVGYLLGSQCEGSPLAAERGSLGKILMVDISTGSSTGSYTGSLKMPVQNSNSKISAHPESRLSYYKST